MRVFLRGLMGLLVLAGLIWLGLAVNRRIEERKAGLGRVSGPKSAVAVPVEVAEVKRGPIELRRDFSGTLAAHAQFIVAPKTSGRLIEMTVDLGDKVRRGQLIARLDSDEFQHAVARAEADLAVARARVLEVKAGLEQARRERDRLTEMKVKGVATQAELDAAEADVTVRQATADVAEAQVRRADADLAVATTRLDYTKVLAVWDGGSDERRVAERFVDTGETVSANTPLVSVVEIDPIKATILVTEGDYRRLSDGQTVTIRADAYPDETFAATIERISPVFRRESRQARIEVVIANDDQRLRPGMFVRAEIVFERLAEVVSVPFESLVRRDDERGIFLAGSDGRAHWRKVKTGIQEGDRIQVEVEGEDLSGQVVTLGQQLLADGVPITIYTHKTPGTAGTR